MRTSAGYLFMQKPNFVKLPTTIDEQIQLLKDRGMKVTGDAFVRHCLSTVTYYRLSAYIKPFEGNATSHILKQISILEMFGICMFLIVSYVSYF